MTQKAEIGIPAKSVVKFVAPLNESENNSRMIVLENRGPRTLVVDCAFVNNPNWPIPPTSVYATADLTVVRGEDRNDLPEAENDQCPKCHDLFGLCVNLETQTTKCRSCGYSESPEYDFERLT